MKKIDCSGKKYGRLTVMGEVKNGPTSAGWLCRCDCGAETIVRGSHLKSGATKSCGCLNRERVSACHTKHGMEKTAEYRAYRHMMGRCTNATDKSYKNYGGRGIKVCKRWFRNPGNFLADMGPRPVDGTLDRINNDGPYSPENCRWGTRIQQNRNSRRNTRLTFNGETKCISEWAEAINIAPHIISSRLANGFTISRALTQPVKLLLNGRISFIEIKERLAFKSRGVVNEVPAVDPDVIFEDKER